VKRLTLVRHAKSDWGDPTLEDFERPLNHRGERDAPEMARRLAAAGLKPTLIVTSPAVRALATARAFARELGYPARRIRHADEAYLATPGALLEVVRRTGGRSRHVMLVGHNPGISQFVALLTGDDSLGEVPTAGVVSLMADLKDWKDLAPGAATRTLYDYPKNRG
jgi:phosphohistidine phosphatase